MKNETIPNNEQCQQHGKCQMKTLHIVIIFWLGVLTGVVAVILALMLRTGDLQKTGKASLLYYSSPYSFSNYFNTGSYTYIPTPPGNITP